MQYLPRPFDSLSMYKFTDLWFFCIPPLIVYPLIKWAWLTSHFSPPWYPQIT